MDSKQPLLSIIIPTRNRVRYAINAIHTILKIDNDKLELVIQDNSDTQELKEYLRSNVEDRRLQYNYVAERLSFVENFNQALRMATGEYLCLIGDDDGINPEVIDAVEWAKKNNVSAIKSGLQAQYLWPGANTARTNGSTLTVGHFTSRVRWYDTRKEIDTLMKHGGQLYFRTNLPKLYHGIVKRECLEQVRQITGHYFGGLTPDIYIVVALANVVDKVVTIDYPLTIPGACVGSGSIDSVTGKHTGKLEDAPHFRGNDNYVWSEEVPRFYSVETIWADTAIAALKDSKRKDLQQRFNIEMLAAYCITKYPAYYKDIFRGFYHALRIRGKSPITGTLKLMLSVINGPVLYLGLRVINKIRSKLLSDKSTSFTGVNTIEEATNCLTNHLQDKGLSFKKLIG